MECPGVPESYRTFNILLLCSNTIYECTINCIFLSFVNLCTYYN